MAHYISLDPKHANSSATPEDSEMQVIHAYRILVTWLVATLIQQGHVHITKKSLEAAIAHMDRCSEQPTFRTEQFDDGCQAVELVRCEPSAPSQER